MIEHRPLRFLNGTLLTEPTDCPCGRRHKIPFDAVIVRPGALGEAPAVFEDLGAGRNCCLVVDTNTYDAAGDQLESFLSATGRRVTLSRFESRDGVKPEAAAAGAVLLDMGADTDLLVAVGSGCITDVTRFVAARTGTPFVSVPTAPSVDAYTSSSSPMTHRGFKRSIAGVPARAVVADLDVLAEAPPEMIASGFGDTLGKLVSRCDWQLSALITDEYHCPEIDSNVTEGVSRCTALAPEIGRGEPMAVAALAESLMVSGAAMTLVGNSRPASGAEHSLSHYWEMKAAHTGRPGHLHGKLVGVGSVVMAAFWARFADRLSSIDPGSLDPARIRARRRSLSDIKSNLTPSLGPVADTLLSQVTKARLLPEEEASARLNRLQEVWSKMASIAEEAPSVRELADNLRQVGGPAYPADI
ncbi:MAG: iron-containing alcohol dehydrogenase, partial [Spirochaetia bacterium]